MREPTASRAATMLLAALSLSACGKVQENKPAETAQTRAEAKRHKDACGSNAAYENMRRVMFDRAREQQRSHRANLDTLESFSFVRVEGPVVEGWDPALDITRCKGRFILDLPPGSEQAFGGERRLTADIAYTAQGAADASGLVYAIGGAEPIVGKLASFGLPDASYRPLPALDAGARDVANADDLPPPGRGPALPPQENGPALASTQPGRIAQPASPDRSTRTEAPPAPIAAGADRVVSLTGEETVRSFYNALGSGNGEVASAQVIPAKRSSRAYSADAITRFYGRLSDPLRLTSLQPLSGGAYRVTYRYAGAGVRCNGSATIRLTSGDGRPLIRSIVARDGC
jgi:hypothetical protein